MPTLDGVVNDTVLYLTVLETLTDCKVCDVFVVRSAVCLCVLQTSPVQMSVGSRPPLSYTASQSVGFGLGPFNRYCAVDIVCEYFDVANKHCYRGI